MEEDEHLRTLEYFNQPFDRGNGIKILDDLELPETLSLESLSTNFGPVEEAKSINATDRDKAEESFMDEVGSYDSYVNDDEEETPHTKNKNKNKNKVEELGCFDVFEAEEIDT